MQTPAWICADGEAICLSAMSRAHILNARAYLLTGNGPHGPMLRQGCSGFTNAEWVLLFEVELWKRARRTGGLA
jgi:hypothetical protein